MANGNTYQIRVSCGYNTKGEQVFQSMSWKPPVGMTAKQAEKEVQRQAILFEEKCMKGHVTANVKFETFAEQWFKEYALLNLKNTSFERMRSVTKRVYPAFGHFYASALINEGVDVATVSSALGHSAISTTCSVYLHAFQDANARASEVIADVLDFSRKKPTVSETAGKCRITISSAG